MSAIPADEIRLRPAIEIQEAHDTLVQALLLDAQTRRIFGDEYTRKIIRDIVDCLCWVLQHRHNVRFGSNLAGIKAQLRRSGFEMVEVSDDDARAPGGFKDVTLLVENFPTSSREDPPEDLAERRPCPELLRLRRLP